MASKPRVTLRFDKQALAQIKAIEAWWRANRPAAPGLFAQELNDVLHQLEQSPDSGTPYASRIVPNIRRCLLLTTQYHLYYRHVPGSAQLDMLAVWSTHRGQGPRLPQ